MRDKLFRVSKTVLSVAGSYLWLLYLVTGIVYSILHSVGGVGIPLNVTELFDKIIHITVSYFNIVIYVSAIATLCVVLFSDMNKMLKTGSVIFLVGYILLFSTIYVKVIDFAGSKFSSGNLVLTQDAIKLVGYFVIVFILETFKSMFQIGKLTVGEATIKYTEIDDLIEKYASEEGTFNVSLCDTLINKYGGDVR